MFLHTSTFKKLLKESWKYGGITVGRLDTMSLFVSGRYWIVQFDYTSMPNRIKAAIMEFAGELPEPGEVFRACQGELNQYEIKNVDQFNVRERWIQAKNPLVKTSVLINGNSTVYQLFQDSYNKLIPISIIYDRLIDTREKEQNEGSVIGPSTVNTEYNRDAMCFWCSDLCILGIMPGYIGNEDALKAVNALADVDFHKEG